MQRPCAATLTTAQLAWLTCRQPYAAGAAACPLGLAAASRQNILVVI